MGLSRKSRFVFISGLTLLMLLAMPLVAFAEEEEAKPALYGTWWSIVPPLVAIVLALITKEVYSSLFLGVLVGGILYAGASLTGILDRVFVKGIVGSLSDGYNVGILIFLVILGAMVVLMNQSGGSGAFGRWASNKIKSRSGAQRTSIFLGLLIFVDDYFNCLTVGSVMRPVTDAHKISRAKLAYLIDATAAPICIIAPISSWAAAVSGFVPGENGLKIFIEAIPYNFYALFTIIMLFALAGMKFDYGPMAKYEKNALNGDLFTVRDQAAVSNELKQEYINDKGRVIDLIIPIIVLIISCLIAMIYTGGFFDGSSFVDAFANCDASVSLVFGSAIGFVFTIIYYMCRRVINFKNCMGSLPEGFKQMVAPILILTLAWTLKGMTDSLGLEVFIKGTVGQLGHGFMVIYPAIIFLIACLLAFASGTSWGTFGMLIPLSMAVTGTSSEMMIIGISACLAGAVCGDHCSPISDTTIMSSAGAGCNHISHVQTQLPYAITVAAVAFVTFIVAGLTKSPWISLPIGIVILFLVLIILKRSQAKKGNLPQAPEEPAA
ncbi:MAG: Na+/H+ antiporter NhaC family protein [Firmicutes bacterium]|nr:Na+/H+ antiporter NhaC family protein [Bacillota bacterium]